MLEAPSFRCPLHEHPTVKSQLVNMSHLGFTLVYYSLHSKQLDDEPCYKKLQAEIAKNRWMDKLRCGIDREYLARYNRMKMTFVGKGGAGKTSTIKSLLGHPFEAEYNSTIVGDVEFQVSIQSSSDWREEEFNSTEHVAEPDFRLAVEQIENDDTISWKNRSERASLPALDQDVIEAIEHPAFDNVSLRWSAVRRFIASCLSLLVAGFLGFLSIAQQGFNLFLDIDNNVAAPESSDFVEVSYKQALESMEQPKVSPTATIWDLGGQDVFHFVHHLFMTNNGFFLLVFNAAALLNDASAELEALTSWTNALQLHASGAPVFLIGTHAEELTSSNIILVNQLLDSFFTKRSTNILVNDARGLMFFPVDNALGRKNQTYLADVKTVVHKHLTDDSCSFQTNWGRRRIKVSWMYLMDCVIRAHKTHILHEETTAYSERIGLPLDELEEMLIFYTEIGAIVYFPRKEKQRESLSDVVILNPQWLLKAIGCFLYDKNLHSLRKYKLEKSLKEKVRTYENTGILPLELLHHWWSKFNATEIKFLEALCFDMMLFAKYGFSSMLVNGSSMDSTNYLVPAMLDILDETGSIFLPNDADRYTLFIKFEGPMPNGLFERVVCEFVSKSGHFEGSMSPRVYKSYADVSFCKNWVYLSLDRDSKRILVTIERNDLHHVRRITSFTSFVVNKLEEHVLGEIFKPQIIVDAGDDEQHSVCKLEDLWDAIDEQRSTVQVVTIKGQRRTVPVELFSAFRREEIAVSSESRELKIDSINTLVFDCFLAHEWGTCQSGNKTHWDVVDIGRRLTKRGCRVWVDEDHLRENFAKRISEGLRRSREAVVFLTQRYLQRVDDPDTNASKEFTSAFRKGVKSIIVVVLEKELLNQRDWYGIVDYHFGDVLYIDFSTPQNVKSNFNRLVEEIYS